MCSDKYGLTFASIHCEAERQVAITAVTTHITQEAGQHVWIGLQSKNESDWQPEWINESPFDFNVTTPDAERQGRCVWWDTDAFYRTWENSDCDTHAQEHPVLCENRPVGAVSLCLSTQIDTISNNVSNSSTNATTTTQVAATSSEPTIMDLVKNPILLLIILFVIVTMCSIS
eukprot:389705_1